MVHFVGAGPGAVDLITVRGQKLLNNADVVIYAGSLVNKELLSYCKEEVEIHNSAKLTLDEVIDIMVDANNRGQDVVRLHTGDQSIYGAIKEQMDRLVEAGIEFDSTPGVSACFGAASSLNLEYTLPGISQSLIITRMAGKTAVPKTETIESFAAHKSTMAIYLSTGMLEELVQRLLIGGYEKTTPVALVYKATWPEEKVCICTVDTLVKTAKEENITQTALVIVGDVISNSNYELSKLYDKTFSTQYREGKTT